ncbi:MAG TPA: methyltransferase domain-containing protein [Gaiellaceae bacterium]|nr:methyltransferase domain-containing protein [Gaiellaceae bacterium]
MRLDNPVLVRWEFASEERLAKRNAIFRALVEGDNPEDVVIAAVAEARPARLLDVGCGPGELTERFARELGAEVHAVDISPRMIELTRSRGIDAVLADAEELPFGDGEFDCVYAGWVLYHVPKLEQAIGECARVLRPGGVLVAATHSVENVAELWELIGCEEPRSPLSFNRSNGKALLGDHFSEVEQRDVEAQLVFPDSETMRTFVASTIDRAHYAAQVPEIDGPFRATTRHTVFIAKR